MISSSSVKYRLQSFLLEKMMNVALWYNEIGKFMTNKLYMENISAHPSKDFLKMESCSVF